MWPFLLEHDQFNMTTIERDNKRIEAQNSYESVLNEWKPFEEFINLREKKKLAISLKAKEHRKRRLVKKMDRVNSDTSLLSDSGLILNDRQAANCSNNNGSNEVGSNAEQLIKKVNQTVNQSDLLNEGNWVRG